MKKYVIRKGVQLMQSSLVEKPKTLTVKISGRANISGNFLYFHIPKVAETVLEARGAPPHA